MARINLMPWREKRRKERQKAFVAMMGLAAAVAVGLLVLGWLVRAGQIDAQSARNTKLSKEIGLMKEKVAQIQDLDIKRDRLLGRKQVIEDLQSNRSHMVHLFDELVRTLPDGIQLVAILQKGTTLTLEGRAESNSRVSEYLNRLEGSAWLEKADLKIIEEQKPDTRGKDKGSDFLLPYFFRLQVNLANPNAPVLDADGNPVDPETLPEGQDPAPTAALQPGAQAQALEDVDSMETPPPAATDAAPSDMAGQAPDINTLPPAPPVVPAGSQNKPATVTVPGKATLDAARAYASDAPARERAAAKAMSQADADPDAGATADPDADPTPASSDH